MMNIEVKNLCKSYGENKVLDNFNAVIEEGKFTCIMGESGCGKTTLANILLGIESCDSGNISGMPDNCAVVFQEDRLCDDFSAVSNVMIVLPKKTDKKEVEKNLILLGLGDSMYKPVREFSGGMKRRVAILRAVMAKSSMIVFDEAFKGLDEVTKEKTALFIKEKTAGKTVVLITHEMKDAEIFKADLIRM